MAFDKPLVLILGATGKTGATVINGLLASGHFRIAAAVRLSSLTKPVSKTIQDSGVEIRVGDFGDDYIKLKSILEGVDVLISCVTSSLIDAQKDIFRAAKEVGVKRVVPCDWGTPGARGVRQLYDSKLAIHDLIQELGLPYTFIDVGFWMELILPFGLNSPIPPLLKEASWTMVKGVDPRVLVTSALNIGKYVADIISDPRTVNQAVIIWEDEVTLEEAHEIGERHSADGEELRAHRIYVEPGEFLKRAAAGHQMLKSDPSSVMGSILVSTNEYLHSVYILQENTLENAKRLGFLDAKELYPNVAITSLEECAKEFYGTSGIGASSPSIVSVGRPIPWSL